MLIAENIHAIGVADAHIRLFEGQYATPNGMAYNSYCIDDDRIAVLDTVDAHCVEEWMRNLSAVLAGRMPAYLIVQHMEPDHSGGIAAFMQAYPEATVVATAKAFPMMEQFFPAAADWKRLTVGAGSTLCLGRHTLTFVPAPMVHWPEVTVSYDSATGVLFSADAFGTFGVPDAPGDWKEEARRYFIGIVGKYGAPVQTLLKKAATLSIRVLAPLHGPVLSGAQVEEAVTLYDTWSAYRPEEAGVTIAYTSVYGHTEAAVRLLEQALQKKGVTVQTFDLARCDMAAAVAAAFRFDRLVLATTTYNGDVFPFMRDYLHRLTERNFRSRTVGLVENGCWAPMAAKVMQQALSACPDVTFAAPAVRIAGAVGEESEKALLALAAAMAGGAAE